MKIYGDQIYLIKLPGFKKSQNGGGKFLHNSSNLLLIASTVLPTVSNNLLLIISCIDRRTTNNHLLTRSFKNVFNGFLIASTNVFNTVSVSIDFHSLANDAIIFATAHTVSFANFIIICSVALPQYHVVLRNVDGSEK